MKTINSLRAKCVFEYYPSECSLDMNDVLKKLLQKIPSCTEVGTCKQKGCRSKKYEKNYEVLSVNADDFNGNMANLQKLISARFSEEILCHKCRKPFDEFRHTFGQQIFVTVMSENNEDFLHD